MSARVEDEIIDTYLNTTLSLNKMADKFGIGWHIIWELLKKRQVPKRECFAKKPITEDDKINFVNLYKSGMSIERVAKETKRDGKAIARILQEYGVQLRYPTKLKSSNDNYFNTLATPNHGYMLGFIISDGCIIDSEKRGQKQLVINLHEDDKYILESFAKELDFEGQLHFYEGCKISNKPGPDGHLKHRSNLYRLTVTSEQLCNDLGQWGVTPRKSLTAEFPYNVTDEIMPHVIRGMFDGDGYVSIRKGRAINANPSILWGIVGTEDICKGIREVFAEKLGLNPLQRIGKEDSRVVHVLTYAGHQDVRKIYNYLYPTNTELFLTRKQEKLVQIFNYNYLVRNT